MSQLSRLLGQGAQQKRIFASLLTTKTNTRCFLNGGSKLATAQGTITAAATRHRSLCQKSAQPTPACKASNMGLFARYRHMYKKYWYVLIPVHWVTSACWLVGFYFLAKSGVAVPALLQYAHLSENIIEKVQSSDKGHYAIAYLCYKVVTPLRYAVTLGTTTLSIKYLVARGYIKPVPTKKELLKMYEEKKATRSAKADNSEKDGKK
ncbi:uncharacterized protein DMAD_04119 [Drosophila madeirensis]|uniref:DUF1279 domain-containing protein n=1 Tax=Drosophila madeirensis TaxID=30013 RepID=A0AAU9GD26_DROMD